MNDLIDAIKAAHPDHASGVETLADLWLRQLECPMIPTCD